MKVRDVDEGGVVGGVTCRVGAREQDVGNELSNVISAALHSAMR